MRLLSRHRIWQVVADGGLVALAWYVAFQVRFDKGLPARYDEFLDVSVFAAVVAVKLLVFILFGLYHHWWRYVSIRDIWRAILAVTVGSIAAMAFIYVWDPVPGWRLPRGIVVIDWMLALAFVTGARLLTRTLIERPGRRSLVARGKEAFVVGAGDAGQIIIREMLKSPRLRYTPIGLVDDDPRKKNMRLHGVRVVGTTNDLPRLLEDRKPDEVIIAIPSAAGDVRQRIVNACRDAGVPVKTLPSVHELIAGDLNLSSQLREVQVEDVLGREAVEMDIPSIASYVTDATVLVTGAGGSIGSELCRQVAALGPAQIVLVDASENALVDIERELQHDRGYTATVSALADVKDAAKIRRLFERHRPAVVFHAAAYKHIPLVEANPVESVRNNVFGTKVVAAASREHGAKRFVLVSTDKAVRPKNVLGQTKAVCEWIVEAAAEREGNGTSFISVRFGNVLGSSGSVIPIFRRQIERGGPVTVTHPEMERYFMTIPEAVQLIVQAGAIGQSGDVFVLDMGKPVKIVDLARNMIRLSGMEPERDIAVEFIGVRPGEKLREELWGDGEKAVPTAHPKIMRAACRPVDPAWLEEELAELEHLVDAGETIEVVARLGELVRAPRRVGEATAAETVQDGPGRSRDAVL
ncbi:MAG TPA: nucleoside-diphosphate sugar epimerase/dehydratase [Gaiellaceae bacterium]|nr:nucleoside-diphosphate sugar epimerase/dehydratase [Gaiellaceae bacterium]